MTHVAFGTAQLFGRVGAQESDRLLREAWDLGIRRFDTAPLYGAGRAEEGLGEFLRGRADARTVTTKVGLAPAHRARAGGGTLRGLAKRLVPEPVKRRLRHEVRGSFGIPEVRSSIEASLRRLGGRIDRLLLHEAWPEDITEELLALLARYRVAGDVGQLGVATRNSLTLPCLALGGELFAAAQVASGPLDDRVPVPDSVPTRVAHGLLGAGSGQLRKLQESLDRRPELARRWTAATTGTPFQGGDGLARAILSRGATRGFTDVIVATTGMHHLGPAYDAVSRTAALPPRVAQVLDQLVRECGGPR